MLTLQNCDTPPEERISRLTCYIRSTPVDGSGLKAGACLFTVCKPWARMADLFDVSCLQEITQEMCLGILMVP